MLSSQARIYQLHNGHYYTATVDRTGATFKCGLVELKSDTGREIVHGVWGSGRQQTLETVEAVDVTAEDVVRIDGVGFGKVTAVTEKGYVDDRQLRFLPVDKVEKITLVTLQALGGRK